MSQQLTVEQTMALALEHHQANRLPEAEQLYRLILQHHPNHADATNNLGLIAQLVGRLEAAAELMSRSIALAPNEPRFHMNYGTVLNAQGKTPQALMCYARALQLAPNFPEAHFNNGDALRRLGRFEEAAAAMFRSVQLKPDFALAWTALGAVLCELRRYDESIAAFRRAVTIQPSYAEAFSGLGVVCARAARADEAIAACRRAMELEPQRALHQNHLGLALHLASRFQEAESAFHKAIELKPIFLEAYTNLGNLLTEMLRLDEALAAFDRARQIDPQHPDPHYNQAWVYLLRGDFERGGKAHERRWGSKNVACKPVDWGRPLWNGEEIAGKTLFLHAEQGFGDTIHFIRYVPMVAARGARVILGCMAPLERLFRSVKGIDQFIADGILPPFDLHCPLMSLPRTFATRLETIPASVPYLSVEEDLREAWRKKIRDIQAAQAHPRLKVGLAWSGNTDHPLDHSRSIPLSRLAKLFDVAEVRFFSLQVGKPAAQSAQLTTPARMIDLTSDIRDFADTAALIEQLDLVIGVDTAVVHLAGALAKPVWTLLPYKPDWRWMLHRSDSPWYPTMRLFRQSKPGDWQGVVDRVIGALREMAKMSNE